MIRMRKAKAVCSELAAARGPPLSRALDRDSTTWRAMKSLRVDKSVDFRAESCCLLKLQRVWVGAAFLASAWCVYIWLFLVDPKLQERTKVREAGSYRSSPGHLGPLRLVVWLPGLVAAEVVTSCVLVTMPSVCLFSLSISTWVCGLGFMYI